MLYCIFPVLIAIPLVLAVLLVLGFTIWGFAKKKWPVALGGLSILLLGALLIASVVLNFQRAKVYSETRDGMQAVGYALRDYYEKHGSFPKGLKVADLGDPRLPGPEVGFGYALNLTEDSFVLTSRGRDRKPGGEGVNQDILIFWKAGDVQINIQAAYP